LLALCAPHSFPTRRSSDLSSIPFSKIRFLKNLPHLPKRPALPGTDCRGILIQHGRDLFAAVSSEYGKCNDHLLLLFKRRKCRPDVVLSGIIRLVPRCALCISGDIISFISRYGPVPAPQYLPALIVQDREHPAPERILLPELPDILISRRHCLAHSILRVLHMPCRTERKPVKILVYSRIKRGKSLYISSSRPPDQ